MIPETVINGVVDLVSKGETMEAIKLLKSNIQKNDSIYADVTSLEGETSELIADNIRGIISNDNSNIRSNRIRHDLLALIFGRESQLSRELKRARIKEKIEESQEDAQYEKDKKYFSYHVATSRETAQTVLDYITSIKQRLLEFENELSIDIKCTEFNNVDPYISFDFANAGSIGIVWRKIFTNTSESKLILTLYNRPRFPVDKYIWEDKAQSIKVVNFGLTINRDKELRWQSKDGILYSFDDLDEVIFELIGDGLMR